MKKSVFLILLFLTTTMMMGQIRVTPEGYPLMPNKPAEGTLVDNDTIMVQKADGIVRGISLFDFKALLPGGGTVYTGGTGINIVSAEISVEDSELNPPWANITGIPSDIDDGDDTSPILVTEAEYLALTPTEIANNDYDIIDEDDGSSGPGGSGDMLKSVYDTDDDGTVDNSELLNGFFSSTSATSNAIARRKSNGNIEVNDHPFNASTWDDNNEAPQKDDVRDRFVLIDSDSDGLVDNVEDNAITGSKIAAGAVGNSDIADNAINSAKVDNNTLTSDDLASNSVGTSELADNAVTNAKMTDNSVGTSEIIDGSVTQAKLNSVFYDQDDFTPTLTDNGGGATYSVSGSTSGNYTKIGNKVFISISFATISTSGTPSGTVRIGNLPYSIRSGTGLNLYVNFTGAGVSYYQAIGSASGLDNFGIRYKASLSDTLTTLSSATFTSGNITITGHYFTN